MGGDARRTALWGIGLVLVCLVALNAAATFLLRGVRIDLTSDGRGTTLILSVPLSRDGEEVSLPQAEPREGGAEPDPSEWNFLRP